MHSLSFRSRIFRAPTNGKEIDMSDENPVVENPVAETPIADLPVVEIDTSSTEKFIETSAANHRALSANALTEPVEIDTSSPDAFIASSAAAHRGATFNPVVDA